MSPAPARGLAAAFTRPADLVTAARRLRLADCGRLEAYTPYAVEGLAPLIGAPPSRLGRYFMAGGILGLLLGYATQLYGAAVAYPLDVGGRPLDSWPMFVPSANEIMILGAVLGGTLGLLVRIGLPRLHHPVFTLPGFERASDDRFFLTVETPDARMLAYAHDVLTACRPALLTDLPS